MAASLISSFEAWIFSLNPGSNLRHSHDQHQKRPHGGVPTQARFGIAQNSGGGDAAAAADGFPCRGFISRRRRRRRTTLVFCLSSPGDGGFSNSHGDLEELHSSKDDGSSFKSRENDSSSTADENPEASPSGLHHPFLPSRKQQRQSQEEAASRVEAASPAAQSALERAAAYRKTKAGVPNEESSSDSSSSTTPATATTTTSSGSETPTIPKEVQDEKEKKAAVALSAFQRAQAYRKQQAEMVAALGGTEKKKSQSLEAAAAAATSKLEDQGEENKMVEIEIYTRDGIVRRKVSKPETAFSNVKDIKRKGMSDMDFAGLCFADKRSSGTPAGLSDGFTAPTGALPEVEILTRDGAQKQPPQNASEETSDLYKPRVSTWGVFPRPADISKTYGGGRTIRPGESLETPEEKEAREACTQKLLEDYRRKMGLDIDPKIKMQCEKLLKQGESLMDRGLLREALVSFESVMEKISFQSEVHGMAALRGAVCMDSLNRSREAKLVYEKLVSHPNQTVRKKAGQLLFGFQAAENLKVTGGYKWDTSTYRKYFDSFADGYNTMYKASEDEDQASDPLLKQSLPYAIFLIFPILVVFTLAALKNS